MAKPYFRQVPNFDYVSRDPEQKQISQYAPVKNLFRRGKLRDDIFGDLSFFTKYKIVGDERPDNVAYKIYNDETLDWVVLLSNNILNIQSEWPLPQTVFDKLMLEKYGSYESLYSEVHHYETKEIKDSLGNIILPSGIQMPNSWKTGNGFIGGYKATNIIRVLFAPSTRTFLFALNQDNNRPNVKVGTKVIVKGFSDNSINGSYFISNFYTDSSTNQLNIEFVTNTDPENTIISLSGTESIEIILQDPLAFSNSYYYQYYDSNLETDVLISSDNVISPITNYEYEISIEEEKRNIYLLKPRYLNIIFNDLEEIMEYKKGSTQYVNAALKKGDNIRLYD